MSYAAAASEDKEVVAGGTPLTHPKEWGGQGGCARGLGPGGGTAFAFPHSTLEVEQQTKERN